MIKVEDCKDIVEIRTCIDEIDKTIISNLAHRSKYVQKAAEFKKTVSEVKATDRVKAMITSRRNWAIESNINPDFIQSIFERIVDFFVNSELTKWSQDKKIKTEIEVVDATIDDAVSILSLQKRAYIQEAERAGNDYNIDPIIQTIEVMRQDFNVFKILKAIQNSQLIGTVRAKMRDSTCLIGRLAVEPIYQKNGFGRALLKEIEKRFNFAEEFELFTGINSSENIAFYTRHGYSKLDVFEGANGRKMVRMKKKNN